jgi:hypothetical protein
VLPLLLLLEKVVVVVIAVIDLLVGAPVCEVLLLVKNLLILEELGDWCRLGSTREVRCHRSHIGLITSSHFVGLLLLAILLFFLFGILSGNAVPWKQSDQREMG